MKRLGNAGQMMMEFTFTMIIALIMVYSMVLILRWTGVDLAERRLSHDRMIKNEELTPGQQIDPYFHSPKKLDATFAVH